MKLNQQLMNLPDADSGSDPPGCLDIEKISARLFRDCKTRQKLCQDFTIENAGGPMEMADRLVESLGQALPREGETEEPDDQKVVFRAAALALASNMRKWSCVLGYLEKFEPLLEHYDQVAFAREVEADPARVERVKDCLPGRTRGRDATAIVKRATMLRSSPDYLNELKELKSDVEAEVREGEAVPILAAILGMPTGRMEKRWPPPSGMGGWKAPGMRFALASEFLRNLHWPGFKPDTHIKRLIGRWFPEVVEAQSGRAEDLARKVLGSGSKEIIAGLKFSLAGMEFTPRGCSFIKADNLVWALGAYVEKRARSRMRSTGMLLRRRRCDDLVVLHRREWA